MDTAAMRNEDRAGAQRTSLSEEQRNRHPEPSFWQKVVIYTNLSFRYTLADIISRPRNTCVGIFAVFLVVFFSGLVITMTSKTPYLMLRFAEIQAGEMDAMLLADDGLPYINYTKYEPLLEAGETVSGATPRWIAKAQVSNWQEEKRLRRLYPDFDVNHSMANVSTNLLIIDSQREKRIGVGRGWKLRPIGYGETQVVNSVLRYVQVKPDIGDRVKLYIDAVGLLEDQGLSIGGSKVSIAASEFAPDQRILNELVDNANYTDIVVSNATGNGENFTIPAAVVKALAGVVVNETLASLKDQMVVADLLNLIPTDIKLVASQEITDSDGKYAALLGNVAILDQRYFVELMADQGGFNSQSAIERAMNSATLENTETGTSDSNAIASSTASNSVSELSSMIDSIQINDYALMIVALFNDRFNMYYSSSKSRKKKIIRASNGMLLAVGTEFSGVVQYTLASALETFDFFQLFIDSVFITIVVVIIVLGSLLVYMLLVTNAEEKQFEVAMIRAQGMAKGQLLHLMVTQSAAFVIPGLILGVGCLFLVNAIVEWALESFTKAPAEPTRISAAGIAVACCVGVIMPILANYRPVMAALATSLREALSIYRQRANETTVNMVKLEELGLEPWQVILGLFLTVAGFAVYYLLPLSFIYGNMYMFFILLDMVVLVMLFGLCLITYTMQGLIQKALLFCMLRPFEWHLWTLITRNLRSHKERNALTFMMFNISVSCIVFAGVLFAMLSSTLIDTVKLTNGADVTITSLSYSTPINKEALSAFLDTQSYFVAAYTFSTFPLRDAPQVRSDEQYSGVVDGASSKNIRTVAVDRNFQDAVYEEFVLWMDTDSSYSYSKTHGKADVVRNLYDHPGIGGSSSGSDVSISYTGYPANYTKPDVTAKYNIILPCIMAGGADKVLGLTAGSSGVLEYSYKTVGRDTTSLFLVQPRALAQKLSGFIGISSQQFSLGSGNVLISVPAYRQLLRANDTDFGSNPSRSTQLPSGYDWDERYQRCYVRLNGGISDDERTDFVNYLQSQVDPYYHSPADTKALTASVESIATLIMYFFFFVAIVAIALDAVMLWLAFVSNVRAQAWSFGVLRSLGFRVWQLVRAYLYEALVVTISAFITGTVIGVLVAYTLVLQMNLFLDMPLKFVFPSALYFFLLGLSIVAAIAGSSLPVLSISKKAIASVIKGM